jgi:hypothetical protein
MSRNIAGALQMDLINEFTGLVVRLLSGARCQPAVRRPGLLFGIDCCPSASNVLNVTASAARRRHTRQPPACTTAWVKLSLRHLVMTSVAGYFFLAPMSSWSQSLKHHCVNDSQSVVVFLHGFLGDPYASFRADNGVSWQELICADHNQILHSVALSDFDVVSIEWASTIDDSSSLVEVSQQIYELIQNERELPEKYDHLYFIAHSAGGIY